MKRPKTSSKRPTPWRSFAPVAAIALAFGCHCSQGFASVTDTLIVSGKCKTAANWSLGVVPTAYDAYVPAGKTLKVEGTTPCRMRSLYAEGTVAGQGQIIVGNSLRAEGPAGQDIALRVTGEWLDLTPLELASTYEGNPQILDFGAREVRSVTIAGSAHYALGEPATHFQTAFELREGAWFDTAGYDVGGMGWTTASLPSTLKLHASEWDTGEWRVAASVSLEAGEATVYQDDGSYGITECHGQTLGNLIVENFRPHIINPCTIPGTLSLERTADRSPIVFSGAFLPNERLEETRLTTGSLATDGTPAEPVIGEGRVTFVIPHSLTVEGCVSFNEATVIGGTITVDCGGVETVY